MRQTLRPLSATAVVLMLAALAGCALPAHNNTLIFAVKRDLGASLSAPSAAEPEVNLSLGYKERQTAWVPLWANKKTGGLAVTGVHAQPCPTQTFVIEDISCKKGPKLIGDGTPVGDHSNGNQANDAYSTFASFGGNVNVGKNDGPSGSMALASFFATGVAAQNLARNASGLAMVSTVKADDSKEDKKSATSPALRLAEEELLALLGATSPQNTLKDPKTTTKACLTRLGREYDPQNPTQFEWLAGMPHQEAAERWAKASTFLDDEHRKLIGVAYTLRKEAEKKINAAVDAVMKAAAARTAEDIEKATAEANTKRTEAIEAFCAPKAAEAGGTS